ncbi:MAG: NADH-quinone oxidoreductase subunit L [Chitinophagales bacterium]|nr:NADH-quinone oxidoreductase subunit L [Chitinophagales bacterium]MDW8427633.1 NADH-quinone oxidoreductase subunit L [Chitinophagales bacterium]
MSAVVSKTALLIFLMPLTGFVLLGLAGRGRLVNAAGWMASAFQAVSAVAAAVVAWQYFFVLNNAQRGYEALDLWRMRWLTFNATCHIDMGIRLDGLSVMMLVLVSTVSLLVHLYSVMYMHGESRYTSYFAFLQLFTFSMLSLVASINLFQIYFFWELVGVSSYLLIGFHYERAAAIRAAKKAFVVTRFADFGFLIGILVIGFSAATFDLNTLFSSNCHAEAAFRELFLGLPLLTWGTLLMFVGGAGKSAMFPLHIWLPDAMEGPTPVSALIHAATMVVAGVFLVARMFPLFEAAPFTLEVVTGVGIGSALLAAIIACTQTDIKRILAYSTMSQIGLMLFGLGLAGSALGREAGYVGSQFHLFTHGFFKALLFLAAGVVIHHVHSNELGSMGGLRHRLPFTHVVFLIGCLALAAVPPLAGFFSKELILHAAVHRPFGYGLGLLVSVLTAFYMFRLYFLVFWNRRPALEPVREFANRLELISIGLPLLLLAVASVVTGFIPFAQYVSPDSRPWNPKLEPVFFVPPTVAALIGIAIAGWLYLRASAWPEVLANKLGGFYRIAYRKFLIDECYEFLTHRVLFALLGRPAAWMDRQVVDETVNRTGWLMQQWSWWIRGWQSGRLQQYAFWFFLGVFFLAIVVFV